MCGLNNNEQVENVGTCDSVGRDGDDSWVRVVLLNEGY